jgi:hypothetical protein
LKSSLKLLVAASSVFTVISAQSQTAPPSTEASTSAAQAPAATTPAAPAPVWSVGPLDFSGYVDVYYSFNGNRPSNAANGQVNDLYAFDDKTDQFNLEAAKLTINHDPDPVGVHLDLIFGRTDLLYHSAQDLASNKYIEQAYLSAKPSHTHGTELDFGEFTSSAGAELVETMSNWNYSHSILFAWAVPYYHFGVRTSTPITKSWTGGVQVVNGWNNVVHNNGGVTIGLTSVVTRPKYTWNVNYYTGPAHLDTQKGYKNLIEPSSTVHLSLDELEPMDVAFYLALAPWQFECCLERILVFG